MRILTISCNYPNPKDPNLGIFVQRRLMHLASFADVKVIAPISILDYGNPSGNIFPARNGMCPSSRMDGRIEVMHPRWLYPPFGGALNAFCLFVRLLWPIACLRKEFPFEVIDTHFGHPESIAGALLSTVLRRPFTVTLRGNETMHSLHRFRRFGLRLALRRTARVFALSERLRKFAIGMGASPDRIKVIPNGVDTDIFGIKDRLECRRRHGIPDDDKVILSAGALIERKGHHRVARALKSLSEEETPAQLLIVGGSGREGHYARRIRQVVSALGLDTHVRFLGEVSATVMAELMSAADVLCLASTREGCPNVVMEALACGCPVVATDVGAVPDLIPDDRFGFVVPPNQPYALQDALERALRKDWDRAVISQWGQSRSWQQVAKEVFEEICQLVAENAQSGEFSQ